MDKIINQVRDIGRLQGKLLVFGGVYSNLQALEAMKQIADAAGILPENILCTGDVVAYCAQPEESVQMVKNWGIHVIAGNVEIQLRSGEEDCGCNFGDGSRCDLFSRQWYPYAQSKLSPDAIAWMHTLPDHLCFTYADRRVYMLHGSFFDTSEFVFKSTPWSVKAANFEATQADIILSGHCGLPFQDVQDGKYWLNAGVIGMPANDGTTRVWYMILEATADGFMAQHHAFTYNNALAAALMAQNGLPKAYSGTLLSGIWDNCDILPEEETAMQGIALG
jgi:predicted phosphodiesterase